MNLCDRNILLRGGVHSGRGLKGVAGVGVQLHRPGDAGVLQGQSARDVGCVLETYMSGDNNNEGARF